MASFEVAWLIAKYKKPYTIGEDLVEQADAKYFDIQLDETTDFSSNSQQMVYVCYKGADESEEELLFCSSFELRFHGIDVYNKVNKYFNAQSLK
ncbi:hypothetical protein QYM36_012401 [Artemia franciscana]|uniref:Uncharacterized protein n=1 Tax=Artemia franciscana TaxID=6661 RepID=A0AA88L7S3_ARTSF|nr:hypothetical protein QYM36_012401 [Artemia franciscana]